MNLDHSASSHENDENSNNEFTSLINSDITNSPLQINNSNRSKRSRRLASIGDSTVEDIMGQICSKMSSLSTSESSNNLNNEDKVIGFIQVLQCAYDEAYFYLESSAWDIETAVILWLDNHYNNDKMISNIDDNDFHNKISKYNSFIKPLQYEQKEVIIQGLDPKWIAKVSKNTGQIYFTHRETGIQQYNVPPGFADKIYSEEEHHLTMETFDQFTNNSKNDESIDNVSILTDTNDVLSYKNGNLKDDGMDADNDTVYSPNTY